MSEYQVQANAPTRQPRRWYFSFTRSSFIVTVVATIAGLTRMFVHSYTGFNVYLFMVAIGLLYVVAGVWVIVAIWSIVKKRIQLGLIIAPLLLGVLMLLSGTTLPLKARFMFSAPAFNQIVKEVGEPSVKPLPDPVPESVLNAAWTKMPGECPERVGSFKLGQCQVFPAGYLFIDTEGTLFGGQTGIAYLPHEIPPVPDPYRYDWPEFRHLQGHWYAFEVF